MEACRVRPATRADIAPILEILHAGFPPDLLPALPLGSPGAARFLEATLSPWADTDWYVADRGEVLGFCEIRRLPDAICLNHIFVDEKHRGLGLGGQLLNNILPCYRERGFRTIVLDVFSHASEARNWYSRLGFLGQSETVWAQVQLSNILASASLQNGMNIHGLPMAEATQKEYGISEFRITAEKHDYRVGRIGSEIYRCGDSSILDNHAVLSLMRGIDPSRTKLMIIAADGSWKSAPEVRVLAQAVRMQAPLDTVLANLA